MPRPAVCQRGSARRLLIISFRLRIASALFRLLEPQGVVVFPAGAGLVGPRVPAKPSCSTFRAGGQALAIFGLGIMVAPVLSLLAAG
jgi:hypothetical protein